MKLRKYTVKQLRDAIASSTSIRQSLTKLGVEPQGGNYHVFHKAVNHFNIDTSHFTGQGWNKGRTFHPKRPLSAYIEDGIPIQSNKLRKRLIKEGVFEHKCFVCQGTNWLGNPMPLELDHIDGDHSNNMLDNLRLLCPNCHTLTPTYRGRNKSKA